MHVDELQQNYLPSVAMTGTHESEEERRRNCNTLQMNLYLLCRFGSLFESGFLRENEESASAAAALGKVCGPGIRRKKTIVSKKL